MLHGHFAPLKRFLLEWRAARTARGAVPRLRIPICDHGDDAARATTVLTIHKERGRLVEIEANLGWLRSRNGFSTVWRRLGVFVDLLSHPDVADGTWRADLADSVKDDGLVLGFCSNKPESLLVPDRGFQSSGGYARQRRAAAAAPAFDQRDDTIVWRGSPTGIGEPLNATMQATDADLRQRIRMCLLLRGTAGVDAGLVSGRNGTADQVAAYVRAGIAGTPIAESTWLNRKFAIDIDGFSNAFSNLFIRLLYGCCVLKVGSPMHFRQWYYDRLEPWRNFVPIEADMSDMLEKIDWCRRHPDACRRIAAEGRALALSMTPESEIRRAVEAIRLRS